MESRLVHNIHHPTLQCHWAAAELKTVEAAAKAGSCQALNKLSNLFSPWILKQQPWIESPNTTSKRQESLIDSTTVMKGSYNVEWFKLLNFLYGRVECWALNGCMRSASRVFCTVSSLLASWLFEFDWLILSINKFYQLTLSNVWKVAMRICMLTLEQNSPCWFHTSATIIVNSQSLKICCALVFAKENQGARNWIVQEVLLVKIGLVVS